MSKKLPNYNLKSFKNILCYWMLSALLVFFSCIQKKTHDVSTGTLPTSKTFEDTATKQFALPAVAWINAGKPPKIVKGGKALVRVDSSGVGNPFFANYGTDQGLPVNNIICAATDKVGNLWLGSGGAGMCRYDGKRFTNYTKAQGLAGNVVFSILEDRAGNIWIGTTGGLSKYNGKSFKTYTISQGLADNFVTCILQDKWGFLWFGTHDGGVSKYDGESFHTYNVKQGLAGNYVRCMIEDGKGNLWFGTDAGGVSKYDGNNFTNYGMAQGLANNSVNCITEDKERNLWFGTNAGVSKYDFQTFKNYTARDGLADNNVYCALQDETGNLWFGTHTKGVSQYNGTRFRNYSKTEGLPENKISSIIHDKAGNIWIASQGGGVSKYEGNGFTNYTKAQGLAGNLIFGMTQDKSGSLWFGSYEDGVSKYDGKSFSNYTKTQGLPDITIWSLLTDKTGNVWLGSDRAGASKYDGLRFTNYTTEQGLAGNAVISLMEDKEENIWFGTRGNGVSKFDGKCFTNYTSAQGLAGNNVWSIAQDRNGNIWFGTHEGGASKFDGYHFTNYTTKNGLPGNNITAICADKAGDLWFGTDGQGTSKFDGNTFTNYSTEQGLADNTVTSICEDTIRNMLWFGTNSGLSGMKERPLKKDVRSNILFENFTKATGYPIKDVSTAVMFVDREGILWAGSGEGKLVRFDYGAVRINDTASLDLQIQAVKVNNETICWNHLLQMREPRNTDDSLAAINEMFTSFGKTLAPGALASMEEKYRDIKFDSIKKFYPIPVNLVLPYKNNNLTIDFVAITPAQQSQVSYQYKLEGYNNNWSQLSNNSTASFGNINAGSYTLKLRAISPAGIQSEAVYRFTVLPPLWATWWAYTLYALVIAGALYVLYRNRIRLIEKKQATQLMTMVVAQEEERTRISRDLHDDVGVKLSALKLFLSSLVQKASETTNEEMQRLAQNAEALVGDATQDVRQLLLNLSPAILDEFGYTVALETLVNKINETRQLQFTLVVFGMKQRMQKDYELALYRITQELINNILKHASARHVTLQIGQRDRKIILMIEDDGRGFDVSTQKGGYGLRNLEARTKLMSGTMMIDSTPGKGTSVLIEIPYHQN